MRLAKSTVQVCIFAVMALALVGSASADNLLLNSGFETGDLTGWQVFGESAATSVMIVADNGPMEPGTNAAFLDNQGEAIALTIKQSTEPGTAIEGTVTYSFDLKLGQAALGGVFFVEIFAEQSGIGIIGGSGVLGNYTPADWTTISGSFEAPAGTDFLTIQLSAITGAVVGGMSTMYVDNVVLDQGTVPTEPTNWSGVKALFE